MYKRHILHFTMESMKFFFNFDQNSCQQFFYAGLLLTCVIKFLFSNMGITLYDGLITVKEDALSFKAELISLPGRWTNSGMRETILNNIRDIRTALQEDTRDWRLKMGNFRMVK